MSATGRTLLALAAAAIALVTAAWIDSTFIRDSQRHAQANFEMGGFAATFALASLLVAGAVLLLGALAWRAASLVAGLAYVVVGAFFTTLPWLLWGLATARNEAPPVLPEAVASALSSIWMSTAGSLNAVGTIGAGMLIAGVAALVRWWRGRPVAISRAGAVADAMEPPLP